jgi:hypothetical protein
MRLRRFCLIAIAALTGCAEERVSVTSNVEDLGLTPTYTTATRVRFVETQVTETPQPLPSDQAVQSPRADTGATATDESPASHPEPAAATIVIVPAPFPFAPAANAATSAALGMPPAEDAPREIEPSPEEPAPVAPGLAPRQP